MTEMLKSDERKLISIIVPCYNESGNISPAYQAICDVFLKHLTKYDFEIIFLDNFSSDDTYLEICQIAGTDLRVKAVRYSRNFGFNRSLLSGYRMASGDAAIQLDCDLQDPPELFVDFVSAWEKGHDVVIGVRQEREEGPVLHWFRKRFYRLLIASSDDNLLADGGDFRLVDRSILESLRWIDDVDPFVRGLTSFFARRQIGIPYCRRARVTGVSKFPIRRLLGLAIEAFVSHSTVPLRLASLFGLAIALLTGAVAGVYAVASLIFGMDWPRGFTTQVVLILGGISINSMFLGVLGEYIARIHNQLKLRPTILILQHLNMSPDQLKRAARNYLPNGTPVAWYDHPTASHVTSPQSESN